MFDDNFPDDAAQTARTRETILRYHLSWKQRDLEAVLALYHPDVEYNDFYQQRCMRLAELRGYVESNLPRHPGEVLEHLDRIRIDGHTAFIQYRTSLQGGAGLVSFRTGEAIEGLAYTIKKFPDEGRYVPRLLDRLEAICAELPELSTQLVRFYTEFLPAIPRSRGSDPSKYCLEMYERAIALFRANGQPQLAAALSAELTKIQASQRR